MPVDNVAYHILKNRMGIAAKQLELLQPDKPFNRDSIKTAASAMGKKGGLKGGYARAKSLTPQRRSEIAKKAADARWKNKNNGLESRKNTL